MKYNMKNFLLKALLTIINFVMLGCFFDQGCIPNSGDTDQKPIFRGEFPITAEFRNGPVYPKDSYEKWLKKQPLPDGHSPDLITYALILAPENYIYANRFAEENPDILMLDGLLPQKILVIFSIQAKLSMEFYH